MKIKVCVALLLLLIASSFQLEQYDVKDRTNGAFNRLMTKYNETSKTLAEQETKVKDLEAAVAELQKGLDDMAVELQASKRQHVSFQVRETRDQVYVADNAVVILNDVTMNIGDAYNPYSGIFTTPVTGTYHFWANILTWHANNFGLQLMKDGHLVVRAYSGESLSFPTATINYIVKLNEGETIWLQNVQFGAMTDIEGYQYSCYGGTLLHL